MTETIISPKSGKTWWLAYEDGCVWPCEVLAHNNIFGGIKVRPLAPAPDAGETSYVDRRNVYDSEFNRP